MDEKLEKDLNEVIEEMDSIGVDNGDTHAPEQVEEEKQEPTPTTEQEKKEEKKDIPEEQLEKMFTQSQVNELVGNTRKEARDRALKESREATLKELLEKYGVNTDSELDGVFGKGQKYDLLNQDFTNQGNELREAKIENALLRSKIREDRYEDARAILGSKGMDITVENILSMAESHPEWLGETISKDELENISKNVEANKNRKELDNMLNEKPATISKLGTDVENQSAALDKDALINKYFGF